MADSVRRILEEMVPELDALQEAGYFSAAEIRQIIQRRQDFEYALQRRLPIKTDWLRAIAYEQTLERLRALRKTQRNITSSRKKTTLTDYCIIRRTHKLYERMLRKFKGDLSLWNEWLQFCARVRSTAQMSKVLTRMMQLFPTEGAVWTTAASWELERHGNAGVARSLMQTGLRMVGGGARAVSDGSSGSGRNAGLHSQRGLWVEYFRMECLYAARLVARREVLGVGEGAEGVDEGVRKVLEGGVAKVVYREAMGRLVGGEVDGTHGAEVGEMRCEHLSVVLDFLRVLRGLPLMHREALEGYIVRDGLERCGRLAALEDRPRVEGGEGSKGIEEDGYTLSRSRTRMIGEVVSGLAMFLFERAREDGAGVKDAAGEALGVFDEFDEFVGKAGSMSAALYEGRVGVLEAMFERVEDMDGSDVGGDRAENEQNEDESSAARLFLLNECLATCGEACSRFSSPPSSTIVLALSRANQRLGEYKNGSRMALGRSEEEAVVVERLYIASFEESNGRDDDGDDDGDDGDHDGELSRFVEREETRRQPHAWLAMVALSSQDPKRLVRLGEVYVRDQLATATGEPDSVRGTVASCLVNSLWMNAGVDAARGFCDAVLKGPLPGVRFIIEAAKMEQSSFGVGGRGGDAVDTVARIRKIYDTGTNVYGAVSLEIWLEYYGFERSLRGSMSKADVVSWRAAQFHPDFLASNV